MHMHIIVLIANSRFLFLLDFISISPKPFIYLPQGFYFSHAFQFLNLAASIGLKNYETPRYAILPASSYILCLRSRYYPLEMLGKMWIKHQIFWVYQFKISTRTSATLKMLAGSFIFLRKY
jgi:hypothetical protein